MASHLPTMLDKNHVQNPMVKTPRGMLQVDISEKHGQPSETAHRSPEASPLTPTFSRAPTIDEPYDHDHHNIPTPEEDSGTPTRDAACSIRWRGVLAMVAGVFAQMLCWGMIMTYGTILAFVSQLGRPPQPPETPSIPLTYSTVRPLSDPRHTGNPCCPRGRYTTILSSGIVSTVGPLARCRPPPRVKYCSGDPPDKWLNSTRVYW